MSDLFNQHTTNDPFTPQEPQVERQPLIFTERRILPKLFDGLLTCIAWGGFIWLVYHSLWSTLQAKSEAATLWFGLSFNTISLYVAIAAFNSLLLIMWAKYNQRRFRNERRTRPQALADEQLSQHFGLTAPVLEQLKQAQIVVVQHNQDGSALDVSVKRPLCAITQAANDNELLARGLVASKAAVKSSLL